MIRKISDIVRKTNYYWFCSSIAIVFLAATALVSFMRLGLMTVALAKDDHSDIHSEGYIMEVTWLDMLKGVPEGQEIIMVEDRTTAKYGDKGELAKHISTGTNDFFISAWFYGDKWKFTDDGDELEDADGKVYKESDYYNNHLEFLLSALDNREWVLKMRIPEEVAMIMNGGNMVRVVASDVQNYVGGPNWQKIPDPPRLHELFYLSKGLFYMFEDQFLYIKCFPQINIRNYYYERIFSNFNELGIPLVHERYGGNSHVMCNLRGERLGSTSAIAWATELLEQELTPSQQEKLRNEVSRCNSEDGKTGTTWIHFSQIRSSKGYLDGYKGPEEPDNEKNPFIFQYWPGDGEGYPIESSKAKIGNGDFHNGIGIGLWFAFPLELSFYIMSMEDVAVTGMEFGEFEPSGTADVTVRVYRAPGKDADEENAELTTSVVFSVNGVTVDSKSVTLDYDEAQQVVFSFDTPAKGVLKMTAEINPAPRDFEEVTYENNTHTMVSMVGGYSDLPYWAYSRDIEFSTPPATAYFSKPSNSWWEGVATGRLYVDNSSPDIYREWACTVDGINTSANPAVYPGLSGGPGYISKNAHIRATLHREEFNYGDDPLNHLYSGLDELQATGLINTDGPVQQTYGYIWYCGGCSGPEGDYCPGHVRYVTLYEDFRDIGDTRVYRADVYNGMKELPYKRDFKRHFRKTSTELKFDLAWEGTHYPLGGWRDSSGRRHPVKVARWMSHIYANGTEDWRYQAPGQFERTFIGQSSGAITWKINKSMKEFYHDDRERARGRATGKGNYINAVFSTDKLLQTNDWPIKSGYYFNPGGTYQCIVYTEQYKDTANATKEHEELVKKVREAFYYDSSLIYVNKDQRSGALGQITEKDDKTRGLLKIDASPLNLTTTLLESTTNWQGAGDIPDTVINPLFKEVLEGYAESKTDDSYEHFMYREQTDKRIWLVKEETVITFTLAVPVNQKMYTHVNMKNGDYAIMAKVGKIEFDFKEYLNLEDPNDYIYDTVLTMEAFNLDGIKVTVSGSMYDDR